MTNQKPPDIGWMRTFALVGQIGLVICIPIVAGTALGLVLHQRIGGGGVFLLGGIVAGVVIGIFGAYRLLAKEIDWDR
jgi:hypothetical protein